MKLKQRLDIVLLIGLRIWQLLSGILSVFIVVTYLDPSERGIYFTYTALGALQIISDAGILSTVQSLAISNKLDFKQKFNNGELHLSTSLRIFSYFLKAFALNISVMFISLVCLGTWIFSSSLEIEFIRLMLFALLLVASVILNPIFAFLEAVGYSLKIQQFKVVNGLTQFIILILSIVMGFGVWSLHLSIMIGFLSYLFLFFRSFQNVLKAILKIFSSRSIIADTSLLKYRSELFVSSVAGYVSFNLPVQMIYKYRGPLLAGEFGTLINIMSAITNIFSSLFTLKSFDFTAGMINDFRILKVYLFKSLLLLTVVFVFGLVFVSADGFHIDFFLSIFKRLPSREVVIFIVLSYYMINLTLPISTFLRITRLSSLKNTSLLHAFFIMIISSKLAIFENTSLMEFAVEHFIFSLILCVMIVQTLVKKLKSL